MSSLARRVDALEAKASGLCDPFALLDDDELETFIAILDAYHDGDEGRAHSMWTECSEAERDKFERVVKLHINERSH